jgi:hypothetical protein
VAVAWLPVGIDETAACCRSLQPESAGKSRRATDRRPADAWNTTGTVIIWLIEDGHDIPVAAEDPENLDAVLVPVDDQVRVDRPEQDRVRGEIRPTVAEAGELDESPQCVEDVVQDVLGRSGVIEGDGLDDLRQVGPSLGSERAAGPGY